MVYIGGPAMRSFQMVGNLVVLVCKTFELLQQSGV